MESSPRSRTLSIIIPCYNEAATIAGVIARTNALTLSEGWEKEVIVVDDGSGKETLDALYTIESLVRVMYRKKNGGKGAAVKDGLRAANGDYCIIQDADVELDPAQIGSLLEPLRREESEAVCGYRILAPEMSANVPMLFFGGKMVSLLFNIAFGTSLRDVPCCYKVFPKRLIPALLETPSDDFVFDAIELTHVILRNCTITQLPVIYRPRSHAEGKKLRFVNGIQCVIAVFLLRAGLHHSKIALDTPIIARFVVVGGAATLLNLGTLLLLTEFAHLWYLASSVIAFTFSYAISFLIQKFWTFRSMSVRRMVHELPLHLFLALFNLGLNTVLLFTLVQYLHLWYVLAQILTTVAIACISFVASRKIFS